MLERLKVLLVDDNHHMINIVKTILRGFGVKDLYDASNVQEAFQIVRASPVDIVITDFAMDPVDGCAFTRALRTSEESPNHFIPIIMLTAYAERSKVEQARDAGVTEFCAKPVTATELYRKVCGVINTPRSFVRTRRYFGPDRRRKNDEFYFGQERREPPVSANASDMLDKPAEAAHKPMDRVG